MGDAEEALPSEKEGELKGEDADKCDTNLERNTKPEVGTSFSAPSKALIKRTEHVPDREATQIEYIPRVFQAKLIYQDPPISVIEEVIDGDEINELLRLAEGRWIDSIVGRGPALSTDSATYTNVRSPNRTSQSCMLLNAETPLVERIERRIACVANVDLAYVERLNLVRYYPGQYFRDHHDGSHRQKTVFIYLNTVPSSSGGETRFPHLGLKVWPTQGTAILWPNITEDGKADMRMVHSGEPVTGMVKYAVNCFISNERVYNPHDKWRDVDIYRMKVEEATKATSEDCREEEATVEEACVKEEGEHEKSTDDNGEGSSEKISA